MNHEAGEESEKISNETQAMKNSPCIFCGIIAGGAPAHLIDGNDEVIVFLSLEGTLGLADPFGLSNEFRFSNL